MVTEHHAQFTSQELPTLTELCMKHTLAVTSATQCPCCSENTDSQDQFYRHLAKHMEDIATLSLMPDLSCVVSTNVDTDLQLPETIPSRCDQETSAHSTGPTQQDRRGRIDEQDTQGTLRRNCSAPGPERGLGIGSHDVTPLGGTSNEPSSSHGFRRQSWNGLPKTTQSLASDLDYPKLRKSRGTGDAHTASSSVTGAHESTSLIYPSAPESSEAREHQDHKTIDDTGTFEIDEELLRAIFSPESGYQDLAISKDDAGPVCFVEFESIVLAFRAAYKLNHQPTSDSNTTRLSIDLSGRLLSVRVATGPELDLPLLDAMKQHPHTPRTPFFPVSEQYQNHEQTDQSWWATKPYTHGSA
jgi:hypothetical protein